VGLGSLLLGDLLLSRGLLLLGGSLLIGGVATLGDCYFRDLLVRGNNFLSLLLGDRYFQGVITMGSLRSHTLNDILSS